MNAVKKFFATLALLLLTSSICAAESNFDILATTYSEQEDAALTLIRNKTDGELYFTITDDSSKSMAFVKFESRLYNFYLNKGEHGIYSPLMFVLICPEEVRGGSDEILGVWKDSVHLMPIYALFDVRDGQIVFDAPNFYSGEETLTPSHYHSNVTEPVHSRQIEIFMRHMPELHKQVQARGVVLP